MLLEGIEKYVRSSEGESGHDIDLTQLKPI